MGVEYRHFIIPSDQTYVASKSVIQEFDVLLEKWGLKADGPKIIDLTSGDRKTAGEDHDPGFGIGISYPEVQGQVVQRIMGPSYYEEVGEDDRYIDSISLITGTGYRIHPSDEQISISVVKPPEENGVAASAYCEYDEYLFAHDNAWNTSYAAKPPVVEVESEYLGDFLKKQNFKGYWRTAISIDCGKDLPKVEPEIFTIPNREFISDVEKLFKCRVIEVGMIG